MLKGILLQTMQGIIEEIKAVLYVPVAFSQQNPALVYCMSFISLIQQIQINYPVIINCT